MLMISLENVRKAVEADRRDARMGLDIGPDLCEPGRLPPRRVCYALMARAMAQ